ncbi:MAG TPA: hypothetical protein VKH45_13595 [Candidatus Acidoferrum sp.]|nr:hypothetical protein [Candidatus Acidoferrum sp.]
MRCRSILTGAVVIRRIREGIATVGGGRSLDRQQQLRERVDFFEDFRRGVAGNDVDTGHTASRGFHFDAANNLVVGPITTFDENVREQSSNHLLRSGIGKNGDSIDTLNAG